MTSPLTLATLHIADANRSEWEVDLLQIHFHQNGLWVSVSYDGETYNVDESYDDILGMVESAKARITAETGKENDPA